MKNRTPQSENIPNHLILGFFFITGLTGLAYELVWIRLLILAFGSTQFAVTTVLVTFMAGLALGSFIFGRVIDRYTAPLKVYAAIEVVLGVYCVLSPFIFTAIRTVYTGLSGGAAHSAGFEAAQFILSFSALIIPTTLMGGTLPVLVKYLAGASGRVGFHTAVPYSINTLGAVTGCLVTGFFSLYALGVKATVYLAGGADILVGVLVLLIWRAGKTPQTGPAKTAVKAEQASCHAKPWLNAVIIATFALSGFCSLAYEGLWTRVFSLVLGSSIYAFTIMLATFLVGIGAGSILFAPFIDKRKNPVLWFAALEGIIGLTSLFSIFAYRELPFVFFSLKEAFSTQFWLFLFVQFILCAAIMIIPTLCMGAIFPLVGRIYTKNLSTVGKNIGDIYFFNTAGSIFGAFAGGFLLIPYMGVQNGVVFTAALNIMICAVLVNASGIRQGKIICAALAAVFVVTAALLPPWEKMLMTLGLYVNPVKGSKVSSLKQGEFTDRLLYYKEGINAIITVRQSRAGDDIISYQANGKLEAKSIGGMPTETWSLLGHIPLLLHKGGAQNALVVGLGSGITLGAMQYYPLKSFDVVELEPAVIEAARHFSRANNGALDDPRVAMHVNDGRSFLSADKKTYDIVVSGVSDPWITGVSNLFTYEYFDGLGKKLNKGGIAALWFQNYRITPNELKIGLNTFASVFPFVSVWFHYTDTLDLIVIGSREPHGFDMGLLRQRFADQKIRGGLSRINVNGPYDVLDLFLIGNDDLRAYIGRSPVNTDERPILEFTLPKHLYMDVSFGIKMVEELLANAKEVVPPVEVPEHEREAFYLALGKTFNRSNFRLSQAMQVFQKAVDMNPRNKEAAFYLEGLKKELNMGYNQ